MNGTLDQCDERSRQGQTAGEAGGKHREEQPNRQRLNRSGLRSCNLRNTRATPRFHRQAYLSCNRPTDSQGCQGLARSSISRPAG